jgi:sugar lactone lactonase YvrE
MVSGMRIGKIFLTAAVFLGVATVTLLSAAAGTSPNTAIFVDNSNYVTAYPIGSKGDVAPIALTTDMISPGGIARDATGRIYVTNTPTNTVTIYAAGASGNVPPLAVIGGSETRLANPTGIALDASANIYVLNAGTSSIAIFAPLGGNTGIIDQAPAATIRGSKTHLNTPVALAVGSSGKIYVANRSGGPKRPIRRFSPGVITSYAAGSVGDVAPAEIIRGKDTGLTFPESIAVDAAGVIYVGNGSTYPSAKVSYAPNLEVFGPDSTGDARPTAVITGDNTGLSFPQGIAVDSQGNIYATGYFIDSKDDYVYAINLFPSGSNGNVAPAAVIGGPDTGLGEGATIALDAKDNLYVANEFGGPNGTGSVTEYASGSSGNAAPTATFTSHFNGISGASGIALDASGKIYVPNSASNSIAIYAAGSYGVSPPIDMIAGADTELFYPTAIGLDGSGNIVVLNAGAIITEYAAGSIGDANPTTFFEVGNGGNPVAIAVGPRGAIYVASQRGETCDERGCFPIGTDNIAVYLPRGAGNSKPAAVISGPNTALSSPFGVALDTSGNIYVANTNCVEAGLVEYVQRSGRWGEGESESCTESGSITIYASGSNGDAKPVATIAGANTELGYISGITVDRNGNIYVLNTGFGVNTAGQPFRDAFRLVPGVWYLPGFLSVGPPPSGDPYSLPSILIFKPGTNGDIAPTAVIAGPFTALSGSGIAFGPSGP